MQNQKIISIIFELYLLCTLLKCSSCKALPANLCLNSGNQTQKTWGPFCENLCRCRHNSDCDSNGYCAKGCNPGWRRNTKNGSCSFRIVSDILTNETSRLETSHNIATNILQPERRSHQTKNSHLYRISPVELCVQDKAGIWIKIRKLTSEPPIFVTIFKVGFDIAPRREDFVTCTFRLSKFPGYSVTKELVQNQTEERYVFSAEPNEIIVTDSVIISVRSKNVSIICSPAQIAQLYMYGLPICKYRKWGIRCDRDCQCPCTINECHPVTGRCLLKGYICPSSKYGPSCSYNCSRKCYGIAKQCHILSGTCKLCKRPTLSGVNCDTALSFEDVASRDRLCEKIPDNSKQNTSLNGTDNAIQPNLNPSKSETHRYAIAATVLILMTVFLLTCCSYVQMVHYCAKKRMKEHIANMNEDRRRRSSMVTFTEFNKEFMEMQEYRKYSQPLQIRRDRLSSSSPIEISEVERRSIIRPKARPIRNIE